MASIQQSRHWWMKQWHRPVCRNNNNNSRAMMTTSTSSIVPASITARLLPAAAVRWSSSSSSSFTTSQRRDPFARRPTAKCDPYGQGGKPLTLTEATHLLATVDPQWKLWKDDTGGDNVVMGQVDTNSMEEDDADDDDTATIIPFALCRDFGHADYSKGAEFITHVAAVAAMNLNHHYPYQVTLERYLQKGNKQGWQIRTRVLCRTVVLQGLSHHDFFLATMLDVECGRPELQKLLLID
jgi:hypothetical protein